MTDKEIIKALELIENKYDHYCSNEFVRKIHEIK